MATTSPRQHELDSTLRAHDPRGSWRDVLCAWLILLLLGITGLLL